MDKTILLVAEGETDVITFKAIAKHLSDDNRSFSFEALAPQRDATSGTYPTHGFGQVLNWCQTNKNNIQKFIDFRNASALLVQMDTDIAHQINENYIAEGQSSRQCCENELNNSFGTKQEPESCHYILSTESIETWVLASHDDFTVLDSSLAELKDYELITDTEQFLISLGYPSRKKVGNKRKLDKRPAQKKYAKFANQLTKNLSLARQRCQELDRLCELITTP